MSSELPVTIGEIVNKETEYKIFCSEFYVNDCSGLLNIEEKHIILNKLDDSRRIRFTIAYLYSILKSNLHLIDEDEYCILKRSCCYHLDKNIYRRKAYKNAANLLIPEQILEKYIGEEKSVLAKIFEVPQWTFRLRKLNE